MGAQKRQICVREARPSDRLTGSYSAPEVGFEESWNRHLGFGDIVTGVFTPVLAKHSKSFSLIDCISVGVDRMQRNFEAHAKTGGSLAEK